MKNKSILILALTSFVLISCNKTNELYLGNAYDTGNFETNYYLEYNNIDKVNVSNTISLYPQVFAISNPGYGKRLDGVTDEDQKYNDQYLEWNLDTPHEDYGKGFGPTNNLTSIDSSFSCGFLSRLYDGRVRCDGYYAKSRVQINKTGFGTFFPKEMTSGKYFAMSLRGETSCGGYKMAEASVDLTYSFYKRLGSDYERYDVSVKNVKVPVNNSGDGALFVFYFIDLLRSDGQSFDYVTFMNGIVGMSMTYSLNSITPKDPEDKTTYGVPVDDKDDTENPHLALMLYEMMMPKSTWR